jgi:hypothetical protein
MILTTSADAVAKATFNALLFSPKKEPWDMAQIHLGVEGVSWLTSDSYALCQSDLAGSWDTDDPKGVMKISREALAIIEERARKDKKERVQLYFRLGLDMEYRGENPDNNLVFPELYVEGEIKRSWDDINVDVFSELLSERNEDAPLGRVLIARDYLGKLRQVKADKDVGADFWPFGPDEPILIKVGPDVKIVIEPIEYERHETALGEDVTW